MVDTEKLAQIAVKVFGMGGGGCNAVTRMCREPLAGGEYIGVNTDAQHLIRQEIAVKVRIGGRLTRGLGVGGDPERGLLAAPFTLEATPLAQRLTTWAGRIFETPAPQPTPERQRTESSLAAVGAAGDATARDG